MFRPMRRFRQQMTDDECNRVLKEERRGVLSMHGDDGYPYGIPVNFYYNESDGKIYLHGAGEGKKIDSLKADSRVCFCVYTAGEKAKVKRGLDVQSVVVFGHVDVVQDRAKAVNECRNVGLKYFPDDPEYIEEEVKRNENVVCILAITIDHMTGKKVNES